LAETLLKDEEEAIAGVAEKRQFVNRAKPASAPTSVIIEKFQDYSELALCTRV